jgi:GTPase-associated protein 1
MLPVQTGSQMSQELRHTSVPRGLDPSKRGFRTVLHTAGVSPVLIQRLKYLSGYQWVFPAQGSDAL